MLGDYVFSISLYIWVYGSTESVVALSSSIFFQFLPRLIMSPNAAITMIARPSKSAVVPLVIKKELLIKYNSFKELTESLLLGGILAVTGFSFVITIDIVSFIVSATLISTISLKETIQFQEKNNNKKFTFSGELKYAVNLFKANHVFSGIASITVLMALAQGGINVLFLPFLLEVVKASEVQFGIVLAIFYLIAGIIGIYLLRRKRLENIFHNNL